MAGEKNILATAERRVPGGAELVARQKVLVDRLERGGHAQAARIARRVLRTLEDNLAGSHAPAQAAENSE